MDDPDPPRKHIRMSEFSWSLNDSDFQSALWDLEDSLPEELLSVPSTSQAAQWWTSPSSRAPNSQIFSSRSHPSTVPPPYAQVIQSNPTMQAFPSSASQQRSIPHPEITSLKRPHPSNNFTNRYVSVISSTRTASASPSNSEPSGCCPQQTHRLLEPTIPSMTFAAGIRQRLDLAKKCLPRRNFLEMLGELKDVMGNIRGSSSGSSGTEEQHNMLLNSYLSQVFPPPPTTAYSAAGSTSLPGPSHLNSTQLPVVIDLDLEPSPPTTPTVVIAEPTLSMQPAVATTSSTFPSGTMPPTKPSNGAAATEALPSSATLSSKLRLVQQHMVLLMHAYKCVKGTACSVPQCPQMRHLALHMNSCKLGRTCTLPHCVASQKMVQHWKSCSRQDCPLCGIFRRNDLRTVMEDILGPPMTTATRTDKKATNSGVNEKGPVKESEGRTCIVCMEQEITHAIVPCGHTLCGDCGQALQKAGTICHVCRGPIHKFFRIYLQ